ncbi:golgin subfamily A member 6-like protein 22 [Triticum aestivum]|uniref:golgin subfamily A member 6-like protein 22 n=1 Tax=Triticum aestivum TaxID=4565 RepID=UPI001D021840|nr:golgin subfamily A member 6-like protein 22 [Triticum aestivum]
MGPRLPSSPAFAVMRKRASSGLTAYLIARQEIQRKMDELAEKELGPDGKERFLATLLSQDKMRSMEEMIADSARNIFQEFFHMLHQSPMEEEEEEEEEEELELEEEEEEEEDEEVEEKEEEEEDEEELEEEEDDEELRMTVQVSFLCDQIGDLVLELLKMVPDEEPGNQLLSSVTRLNRLQWITDSINNFASEIQVRVSREQMIERTRKEKEEQKRFLQQGQEVRTSEKKQEQERTLEEREINGQVMVAGGRLVTMATDRGLEGEVVISEAAAAAAEYEEEAFARFRRAWECRQGANSFEDLTLLSPMLFTHCTLGFKPVDAVLPRTMHICSIKVTDLKYFKWPLQVYGVVAARDAVDGRRNPIFLCPRDDCQILNEADPFLHLTGPIRAVVSEEPVDIEIQLIIKGKTASHW